MAKKATNAQIEQRIRVIYELILSDTPRTDILQYSAKNWGLKTRATDTLIARSTELIAAEADKLRTDAMERHLAQRALLRHKAAKANDRRLVFDILRDESKLLDLYPADRKEISGQITNVTFDDEERTNRIIEILNQGRERRDRQSSGK